MKKMIHPLVRTLGALAVLVAALSACIDSDEAFVVEPDGGALFDRYVALGNSITAGFQSAGINVALQRDAYPVILAAKAEAPFGIPALAMPGCPPPLDGPLGEPISTEACALRILVPPPVVQNLAVPGATVADATDPIGTGTTLNTLILGGRTQVGAMLDADPSLVSVWLGNNDALGAALSGNTLALTPLADFQAAYDDVVAGILATDAQDAILIGAGDPTLIPALQPGAYFWALAMSPPPGLPPLDVSDNCSPVQGDGTPNPLGFNLISFVGLAAQIEAGSFPVVVDCAADAFVVDAAERVAISTRVAEFNAYIEQQASDNGWIYVDPNTSLLGPALADPSLIRKCQLLATATPETFAQAVMASCPVDLDPTTEATFFGDYFSFDGVHPSSVAHQVIADTLAGRLNAKHGLGLD
jgi:hypothetical protein